MAAIKALQQWCRQQCEGYRDVNITNMTTSFRDGLAFCAILHRHRPDLINFDALRKENIYENNKLAFTVAEEKLGIPALLDAEDMVALKVPDRLSILTYASQYYNYFHGRSPIGGMAGVKRPSTESMEEPSGKKAPAQLASAGPPRGPPLSVIQNRATGIQGPPLKAGLAPLGSSVSSICAACGKHVHLVQRHLVDGKLYHRNCFRCKQCSNTLHSGTYRTTEEPGIFVCTSHQPTADSVSPMTLHQRRAAPRDPSTSQKAQEQNGLREAAPGARQLAREPMVDNSASRRFPPSTPDPPTSAASSHGHRGSPTTPRLPVGTVASSPIAKASMRVTNSSPVGWSSLAQGTSAAKPQPSGPINTQNPFPAVPQTQAAPREVSLQTKLSPSPVSLAPVNHPAWTPGAVRTQQAREKFFQASSNDSASGGSRKGTPVDTTPSVDSGKQQALSFLRKALPASSRSVDTERPGPAQPLSWGGMLGSGPPTHNFLLVSPWCLVVPAVEVDMKGSELVCPLLGEAGRKRTGVTVAGSTASVGTRMKPEEPLATKGPSASTQGPLEDSPAGWRARLKPVDKKNTPDRSVEPKESQAPGGWKAGDAPRKVLQSSQVDGHSRLTPMQNPGPTVSDSPSSQSGRRRLAVPDSLDVSGAWLQPESPGQGPLAVGWKKAEAHTRDLAARPHPDYVPQEEIQRQVRDIERQLDELELKGVELERQLRAAEGDATEDELMVDWFRLIHEKQLLLRLESELMYKSKDQRLEQQQLGLEEELRRLMDKPEALKSPRDRQREDELLHRYVDTVNDRSDIVDCLDEDRLSFPACIAVGTSCRSLEKSRVMLYPWSVRGMVMLSWGGDGQAPLEQLELSGALDNGEQVAPKGQVPQPLLSVDVDRAV
ncbi:PREDICTED: MICAL-like protein 2 [Elephantulus edwardii]|uniref:MICAL-like protein 2 n=1 Tax=Elephantulus edwardii TaxID=28737 RepID=UPI0003F0A06A|nr:PREDICTED: MICAL-like protein 2 [Elephantulus edwardii]